MARRGDHSLQEIKAMILAVAQNIVAEQGYSALTVRKIAMEMGYTVGSIYMVFTNMADLLWHLKAQTLDEILLQLQNIPEASLESYVKAYVKYASQNFNRWITVFEHEQAERPDWYQQKIDAVFEHFENQFKNISPAHDNNTHLAAQALCAGVHGICVCMLSVNQNSQTVAKLEEAVLLLLQNFMRGWRQTSDCN